MGIELRWDGDSIDLDTAAEQALQAGADLLLDESNRIAPIETGDLIRSGRAIANSEEAAVGYNSVYAARQHEEVTWRHDAGRQAKYLETALNHNSARILDAIADEIKGHLQ